MKNKEELLKDLKLEAMEIKEKMAKLTVSLTDEAKDFDDMNADLLIDQYEGMVQYQIALLKRIVFNSKKQS